MELDISEYGQMARSGWPEVVGQKVARWPEVVGQKVARWPEVVGQWPVVKAGGQKWLANGQWLSFFA